MIRNADIGISSDAKEKFDSLEHDLNDEELLQFLKPKLMKLPDYFNEVAVILARKNNFTKLDNGKYLILGAY